MLFIFQREIIKLFIGSLLSVTLFFLFLIFSLTSIENKAGHSGFDFFLINFLIAIDDVLRIYDIVILISSIVFSFRMSRCMNLAILEFYGLSKLKIFKILFFIIGFIGIFNILVLSPILKFKIARAKILNFSDSKNVKLIDTVNENLSYISFFTNLKEEKGGENYSNFLSIEELNGSKSKVFYSKSASFSFKNWDLKDGFFIDLKNKNVNYFDNYSIKSSFKRISDIRNRYTNDLKIESISFYKKISMIFFDTRDKIKSDQIESVKISLLYDIIMVTVMFFNFSVVLIFNFSFDRKKNYLSSTIKIFLSFLILKNIIWFFESLIREHPHINFIILFPSVIGFSLALFIVYLKDIKNEKALHYVS